MAKICIHLGLHKTASSYLQEKILNTHPDIFYWGKPWINPDVDYYALKYIFNEKNVPFEKANINKIIKLSESRLNFFSEERLSSSFFYKNQDMHQGVKRMSEIFNSKKDNVKIVIFLRNQSDLIISRYSENNNLFVNVNSNWDSFKNFINIISNKKLLSFEEARFLDSFNHYQYLKILEKYFKPKNIGIFFYEDLANNPKDLVDSLFKFLEINSSKISTKKIYPTRKLFGFYESKNNKFYSLRKNNIIEVDKLKKLPKIIQKIILIMYPVVSFTNFLFQIIKNPIRKDRKYTNSINEYFKDDNAKLSRYLNVDIKQRGYYF